MRICVYAICKNEEQFVDRWMDSMGEADLVVVTDTGSTDGTVERLRARGAVVFEQKIEPWRFDVARNASLANVPREMDICVCTDLDEVFTPGWRSLVEMSWAEGAKSGKYLYNWSLKSDGTPDVQFYYDKIHSRHGFRWKCPVHEYLVYEGEEPLITVPIFGVVLSHHPDDTKSRGSYLPLLELGVAEEPEDERMRFYLGREYFFKRHWRACAETLRGYLALPHARWAEERGAAMRLIAQCHGALGERREAYMWFYRAVAEVPSMREGWVEFAQYCYESGDWVNVFYLTKEALAIKQKSAAYINMGYAWDHTPDDLCALACYQLGFAEMAKKHARAALEITPTDERLRKNLELMGG